MNIFSDPVADEIYDAYRSLTPENRRLATIRINHSIFQRVRLAYEIERHYYVIHHNFSGNGISCQLFGMRVYEDNTIANWEIDCIERSLDVFS